MRMLIRAIVCTLVLGSLVHVSLADEGHGFEAMCYDSVTSPGETIRAACVLTNETDLPATYKVKARIQGDDEVLEGRASRARGRKMKFKVRVGPGQTVVREVDLRVPRAASGPIEAVFKMKGPDGKQRVRQSLFAHDVEDDSPLAEEPVAMSGTVTLLTGVRHSLLLSPDEGDDVRLVGHEALELEAQMRAVGQDSIPVLVSGYVMEGMPFRMRRHMMRDDEPPFLLLAWESDGLDAPEDTLVPYRPLMAGIHCDVDDETMMVIRDEERWGAAMALAGIDLEAMMDGQGIAKTMMMGGGMGFDGGHDEDDHASDMGLGGFHQNGHDDIMVHEADGEDEHGHGLVHHDDLEDMDFGEHMLLAMFAGDRPSDGYRMEMRGITREDDGTLTCRYAVVPPDDDQIMSGMSQPFMVVAVPRTDMPVRFVMDED